MVYLKLLLSMKEKYIQLLIDDHKQKNPKQNISDDDLRKNYDKIIIKKFVGPLTAQSLKEIKSLIK